MAASLASHMETKHVRSGRSIDGAVAVAMAVASTAPALLPDPTVGYWVSFPWTVPSIDGTVYG